LGEERSVEIRQSREHGGRSSATPLRSLTQRVHARWQTAHVRPLCCRIPPFAEKVLKNCIDTENRNLVSRAPGSKQAKDFYPVGSLSVRALVTTKTNETGRERTHKNPCIHSINLKR